MADSVPTPAHEPPQPQPGGGWISGPCSTPPQRERIHGAGEGAPWCERLEVHEPGDGCTTTIGIIDRPGLNIIVGLTGRSVDMAADLGEEGTANLTNEEAALIATWLTHGLDLLDQAASS